MSDLREHVSKSASVVLLFKTFRVLLARQIATFSSWPLHLLLRRLAFQQFPKVKIGSSLEPQRISATSEGIVTVKILRRELHDHFDSLSAGNAMVFHGNANSTDSNNDNVVRTDSNW